MLRRRSRRRPCSERQYGALTESLRHQLAKVGYAVVPLLDRIGLDAVRAVRTEWGPAPGDPMDGLFNDTWSTDVEYKSMVRRELAAQLTPAVGCHLHAYRALGFAHIVKWPGDGGEVVAHRDPTFVDETRFRSLMMWCPLDDVGTVEGALWVVPGSHSIAAESRVHQSPDNLVKGISPSSVGPAHRLDLSAGEAVIYDHALVHLSGPNRGSEPRVVVASPLLPMGADPQYSVTTPDGDVKTVLIDEDFFVRHRLCSLDIERVLAEYPHV